MILHSAYIHDIDRPDWPRWLAPHLVMRYEGSISLEVRRGELADRWPDLLLFDLEDVLLPFRHERATRRTFEKAVETVRRWLICQSESGALRYDPSLRASPDFEYFTYLLHHPLRLRDPHEDVWHRPGI